MADGHNPDVPPRKGTYLGGIKAALQELTRNPSRDTAKGLTKALRGGYWGSV